VVRRVRRCFALRRTGHGRLGFVRPVEHPQSAGLRLAIIVPFLNEERYLPDFLASMGAQSRPPDRLLLVDDGSTDRSASHARGFAIDHPYATLLSRPRRPAEPDRLASAGELRAFQWALARLTESFDVIAKLDADLRLTPNTLADVLQRFADDPRLGVGGPRITSLDEHSHEVTHRSGPDHVEGATKFYRRACLEAIAPIPPILGWDTIDEVRARMRGWRTASFEMSSGPTVHLRQMGAHDGLGRGYRRWGACAYAYGAHPLHVLLVAAQKLVERPIVLGGVGYASGWALAALRRAPRAEPELRAYVRRDQLRRIRHRLVREVVDDRR
jgi:poly-beta-1,6-N-acetyl-D-glucosamine synthase